uniref:U2A'/phosphoprotein 32 family A C-terminal domain-containing protein n=1 Tax=Timema poppense TaxID=170557 RepID=A0A7R9HCS2_TIMPO|nr:unnamed protein product [Timema poppensis]
MLSKRRIQTRLQSPDTNHPAMFPSVWIHRNIARIFTGERSKQAASVRPATSNKKLLSVSTHAGDRNTSSDDVWSISERGVMTCGCETSVETCVPAGDVAGYLYLAIIARRLSEGLEASLPNLETLVLTGNLVQELADLDALVPLKNLRTLSCLQNPVTAKAHYRLYVAFKLPQVKLLDFRKIKMKVSSLVNMVSYSPLVLFLMVRPCSCSVPHGLCLTVRPCSCSVPHGEALFVFCSSREALFLTMRPCSCPVPHGEALFMSCSSRPCLCSVPHGEALFMSCSLFQEREEANSLFKSKKGKELQKEIAKKAKTFVPGAGLPESTKPSGPSPEELWKIREAISKASSLEEVERLNRLLQAGQIPGRSRPHGQSTSSKGE